MKDVQIQSLVTVQAIKDFLLVEFEDQAETKKKCVVAIVNEIKSAKGETLQLKRIDNVLFDNKFVPFIEEMDYALDLEFVPVPEVFNGLTSTEK
jgi:nucleoid-associated protein YejK